MLYSYALHYNYIAQATKALKMLCKQQLTLLLRIGVANTVQ